MLDSTVLYVLGKFLGYALWCGFGLWLYRHEILWRRAIGFGFLRLLIGVGFGLVVFLAYHPDGGEQLLLPYLLIYIPIRWLEWSLAAKLMFPKERLLWSHDQRMNGWRLGGILVSYAIDFLSPEGMAGMFCVGRCLC